MVRPSLGGDREAVEVIRSCRITTSWDDGHPLDLRLGDLLSKYGLPGTFYVPRNSERLTMSPAEARRLASDFELGAHTLDHTILTRLSESESRKQIEHSKEWIEQLTGEECRVFCPPGGRFRDVHFRQIAAAGFHGLRTVEMLAIDGPRTARGLKVLPTTVQAHPHHWSAYARNGLKRGSVRGLFRLAGAYSHRWKSFAEHMLESAARSGGVFHLWGHSWEIEENRQWQTLESVFRMLADYMKTENAVAQTNGSLCIEHTPGISIPSTSTNRAGESDSAIDDGDLLLKS